jgi:arylsulfatase A-like enzyme
MLVMAAAITCACGAVPGPAPDPVNLVILSIDTLRPDHLGLYGYSRPTSPHLDRLAERSVVFDQTLTVHVTTAPAHATILTGRYPGSHGIQRNGLGLSRNVPTLAGVLAEDGWATGAFVSGWTLQRHTGLDRGFARYDDDLGPPRAGARRDGGVTTDAALRWLEDQVADDRRFFLFLHIFEPHWPYAPPEEDALRFLPGRRELTTLDKPVHLDRLISHNRLTDLEQQEYIARYDGEILVADRLTRRLLDALEDLDVSRNTVVVVLSDHGETLFEREWTMDHGARPYDEQALVPLILHLPGDRLAGRRVADQVSLLDITPTVLDIFGIEALEGVQGRSLMPLARGEATDEIPRPAFITARPEPERVPHIRARLTTSGSVRAMRLPGIKFVEFPMPRQRWHSELFDLSSDPGEHDDLTAERLDTVVALHRELQNWHRISGPDPDIASPELDPDVEAALRELGYID